LDSSAIERIFAVLFFCKQTWHPFLSLNLLARSLVMGGKIIIPVLDVPVNGIHRGFHRRVITVVNDGPRHSTENRLDHVQELRTGR
jgi:hypothetical protein